MKSIGKLKTICILSAITLNYFMTFGQQPIYLDSKQPIDKRIEDLLGKMTLEEKVGQINMPCVYMLGNDIQTKTISVKKHVDGSLFNIGPGGGFFTLANEILRDGTLQQAEFFNELQKMATKQTRLKIPLMQIEEGMHGFMAPGATIFPQGLGLGATWDMDLIKNIYASAAEEARTVGVHQLQSLQVEPGTFELMVGSSSEDIRLKGELEVK